MSRLASAAVLGAALAVLAAAPAPAHAEPLRELWPEFDLYLGLNDRARALLLVQSHIAPAEGFVRGQMGGQIELSVAPLREKLFPTIQPSERERATLAVGFRYGGPIAEETVGGARQGRLLAEATFRLLLPGEVLASDRNRIEARDIDGGWSWRYRNRVQIIRGFDAGFVRLAPLASAEVFYDSRSDAWTRLRVEAGVDLEELGLKRSVIELYLVRQFDDRSASSDVLGAGATFAIYR